MADVEGLASGVIAGERRALAKALTLVESTRGDHQSEAQRLLERLLPRTGRAARLGVSGVPGVGKSTFIEALGMYLVDEGARVAVLAVDPSSTLSGGSVLGDKTRMVRLAASERAFVRPTPASGSLGGVARRTREALLVCEAAGYDVVIVETVGVGQSEFAVASMVDSFLLLALPGAGDELQGIKRGILELADVLAVNKADGDGLRRAEQAAAEARAALRFLRSATDGWAPPVLLVSAREGRGMAEVWERLLEHRRLLERSGQLERKRAVQQESWLFSLLREGLEARFFARPDVKASLDDVLAQIAARRITPTEGARRLLALADAAAPATRG